MDQQNQSLESLPESLSPEAMENIEEPPTEQAFVEEEMPVAASYTEQDQTESVKDETDESTRSLPTQGVHVSIPRRPRSRTIAVPQALASTVNTVRGWTSQMRAIRQARKSSSPATTFQSATGEQTSPAISEEAIIEGEPTQLLSTPSSETQADEEKVAATPTQLIPQTPAIPPDFYRTALPDFQLQRLHKKRLRAIWLTRQRRERRDTLKRRKGNRLTIAASIVAGIIVVLISSGVGYSYAYYQSQQPRVQSLADAQIGQSTRIYDRNGTLLYTLYSRDGRRTPISYSSIPGYLQDAMLAAEDPTFWTNIGIDPQGIIRAGSQYISAGGEVQSGGSTITQQLVKNLSNQRDDTLQRKVSEAALAIGLTQQYPKWKILEMYFNSSSFGAQEVGVEAAVQDFFGLTPKCDGNFNCMPATAFLDRDLTKCKVTKPKIDESTCAENALLGLARASFLAGMPQNPVIFDPTVDPANIPYALSRQDYVLQQMLANKMHINLGMGDTKRDMGEVTPTIVQEVEKLTKDIKFIGFKNDNVAPHFVKWVVRSLANALGNFQNMVNGVSVAGLNILNTAGFNIRTTLDMNLEKYTENAIDRHINQPEYQEFQGYTQILSRDNNVHDSAVVVMDAKTGEVLALNGSADWDDTSAKGSGQVNMATTPRQPASTFKPIVLAAAYQMGWYPGIVVPDFKTYFPTGKSQSLPVSKDTTYVPPDYGGSWNNLNTNLELAIANSFNIPAIKTAYYAGLKNVYNMAARLGITSIDPKTDLVPSLPLGTIPVSLLEMVNAYQTFANQGMHIPAQNILDIWDNYGRQLYHFDPNHPNATRVLSPQVAYLVTSTLSDSAARYIEFPNDTLLNMDDWTLPNGSHPQVAAKTGTSDFFKDNWTIGYTPNVVVGVWSGNANESPLVNSIGITGAAPIWHSVIEYASGHCNKARDQVSCPGYTLKQAFDYSKITSFKAPSGIVHSSVNTYNGLAGSGYLSYMIAGEQPVQSGVGTTSGKKR